MGSFIRIGPGMEEGEPSLCGGAPSAVIPAGILKCRDPACTHPKTYLYGTPSRDGWKVELYTAVLGLCYMGPLPGTDGR